MDAKGLGNASFGVDRAGLFSGLDTSVKWGT
jgi:hypothetical protein